MVRTTGRQWWGSGSGGGWSPLFHVPHLTTATATAAATAAATATATAATTRARCNASKRGQRQDAIAASTAGAGRLVGVNVRPWHRRAAHDHAHRRPCTRTCARPRTRACARPCAHTRAWLRCSGKVPHLHRLEHTQRGNDNTHEAKEGPVGEAGGAVGVRKGAGVAWHEKVWW